MTNLGKQRKVGTTTNKVDNMTQNELTETRSTKLVKKIK